MIVTTNNMIPVSKTVVVLIPWVGFLLLFGWFWRWDGRNEVGACLIICNSYAFLTLLILDYSPPVVAS